MHRLHRSLKIQICGDEETFFFVVFFIFSFKSRILGKMQLERVPFMHLVTDTKYFLSDF